MKKLIFCILSLSFWLHLAPQSLKNNYFNVVFNKKNGSLSATYTNGQQVFSGGRTAIFTNTNNYVSNSLNYTFKTYHEKDIAGNKVLIIEATDRNGLLDYKQHIRLFQDAPAIGFEVLYKNISTNDINIRSIEPLRLVRQNSDILYFYNADKCLTNGAMYYDAGNIQDLSKPWLKPDPYGEAKGGIVFDTILTSNPFTTQSWWNIAIFDSLNTESLAAGYLLNQNSLGRLQILKHNNQELSFIAESVLNPGFVLKPGKEISSDQLVIAKGNNPYQSNEIYATLMREKMNQPKCKIVNGWCNWFYTMDVFSENEILENALFAKNHLRDYGLEYIQIDEGFQTTHGDWKGNKLFPHGHKWLCDSIKKLGLKPGIWISPFVIAENSEVYKNHPDWLLKDAKNNPVRIGPWPSENTDWYRNESPKRYCLDITHPEAEKWYTSLIDTIANQWGFEMIKVDFVAWTVFSVNKFYNTSATPAQVYRKALKIMRKVAGDNCHILDCGPGHVSGGYINSMRIEYDQNYGNSGNAWVQYFVGKSSSAGAAGKRWFYNQKTWTNDIDHICIDLLPMQNAQAVATLIGLSGGNTMSGDRLMNLGNSKIAILQKVFPATPEECKPVDLLNNDPQTIFACHVNRRFASWDIVAFFNPDLENNRKDSLQLSKLWLDNSKTYLSFDFWNEKLIGEVKGKMTVTMLPGSVALFSLREKIGTPQIVGTNRHIKQGAIELEAEQYNKDSKILTGISVGPLGSIHSVFVYLPEAYKWQPNNGKIYEYHQNYTIRQTAPDVLRVDLNFDSSRIVKWQIQFDSHLL